MFDLDNPQLAVLAWSRLVEPGDPIAGALVAELGASAALRWLYHQAQHPPQDTGAIFQTSCAQCSTDFEFRTGSDSYTRLLAAAEGWKPRLETLDPARDLKNGERVGGVLLLPDDPRWPQQLTDLGPAAPLSLWVRGDPALSQASQRSVALVGSRASTHYGEQVTGDITGGLVDRGFTIVSGGAYGIDAAAHRSALANVGFTVAFQACGIDQMYPPGNTALLRAITDTGALVTELPPGAVPYRNRFLARNRLIAALAAATVVVEAAWRSGALSTARHAASLLRPVGAVPGPVTSMASGGCHQLVRDGVAVLVTDAAEIAELAGEFAHDAVAVPVGRVEPTDGLTAEQKRVYDALPLNRFQEPATLVKKVALPLPAVLSALGILELKGLAQAKDSGWRRKAPEQ